MTFPAESSFKKWMLSLTLLMDEGRISFKDGKMRINEFDRMMATMADIEVSCVTEGEGTILVQLDKLNEIVQRTSGNLKITPSNGLMVIEDLTSKKKFEIPELSKIDKPVPNLSQLPELHISAQVDAAKLLECVGDAKLIKEKYFVIDVGNGTLSITAKADNSKYISPELAKAMGVLRVMINPEYLEKFLKPAEGVISIGANSRMVRLSRSDAGSSYTLIMGVLSKEDE